MQELNLHDEAKSRPYQLEDLFRDIRSYISRMDVEKKRAISLTFIIMTLSYFLGSSRVFLLNHVLNITSNDWNYSDSYTANYIIFLIMWSPAIYLLSLYWNTKTIKFRLSLAYVIGLLTYRLNNTAWDLYDLNNFMTCFGISALFVCLAAGLIYFNREVKE